MIRSHFRKGYVLLLTVLVVGVMASASAIAIILLGLGIERNAFSFQLSTQALSNAWSCAENAILSLQEDLEYEGNETLSLTYGYDNGNGGVAYDTTDCIVYPISGQDNEDRTICTEGTFGNFTTRRLEVQVSRVLPSTVIESWKEVSTITNCNPYTGPPPANCGNGSIDGGEECDDGNTQNNDGCSSVCLDEVCGDATQQLGEECDDGNVVDGDGCTSICEEEVCGDSTLNVGEECDDGNLVNEDGCSSACLDEECGDGTLQSGLGEECDDGNITGGDGCNESCLLESSPDPSPTDYITYWKLDETNAGDDVVDEVGSFDGEPQEGAGVNLFDKPSLNYENAASRDFDGIDDRVFISDNSSLFPNELTVSFWTKNDSPPSQYDGVLCKTDKTSWSKGWGFFYNSTSQIRFFVQQWNSNVVYSDINPLQWNHVLATYDGTTLQIYVNGIEGTSDTYSGPLNKGYKLYIGRCGSNDDANAYNIDGKVDDVRIFDRVLDPDEIAALASGN